MRYALAVSQLNLVSRCHTLLVFSLMFTRSHLPVLGHLQAAAGGRDARYPTVRPMDLPVSLEGLEQYKNVHMKQVRLSGMGFFVLHPCTVN